MDAGQPDVSGSGAADEAYVSRETEDGASQSHKLFSVVRRRVCAVEVFSLAVVSLHTCLIVVSRVKT